MSEELEEPCEMTMQEYVTTVLPHNILFGEFSEANYRNLVDDINNSKEFLSRNLYLKSYGGNADLIYPIKSAVENANIKLVASQYIGSSAFILFFLTKVDKEVLDDTLGMFHYPYYVNATMRPNDNIRFHSEFEKFQYDNYDFGVSFMKELLGITEKQHKKLLKGGELCFTTKQLRKLVKKSNKMLGL